MVPEQERELLGRAFDIIEKLFCRTLALEAVLETLVPEDWRDRAEYAKKKHAAKIRELLKPFRDVILSSPGGTIPQSVVDALVRKLIESVDRPDLLEEEG